MPLRSRSQVLLKEGMSYTSHRNKQVECVVIWFALLFARRATAATSMNEVSSRSHAIFTVYVTVTVSTKLSHGRAGGGGTDGGEAEDDAR